MKTSTKVLLGVGAAAAVAGAMFLVRRKRGAELGLADGAAKDRIGDLQDVVWDMVRNPQYRELALAVTGKGVRQVTVGRRTISVRGANCEARDGQCEANAVGHWVAQNRSLTHELFEGLQYGPDRPAALACTLLTDNGITCRLRAAKQKDGTTRIYAVAGFPKLRPARWSAVDANLGTNAGVGYTFGRELPSSDHEDFDG